MQDLLSARRAKRAEREAQRLTAEGRAAHLDAESRRDEAMIAGRTDPWGGGPAGGAGGT